MSNTIIKFISAIILAFTILINGIGNFIGVGDIIPTQPEEEITTNVETTEYDAQAAAEFLAFFNAETAKIADNGSYSLERNAFYTKPIDVGGATDILNSIIQAIDENSNLDTVVGGFLGIGVKEGSIPGYFNNQDYMIKSTSLSAADLVAFSEENGIYSFTIANTSNPKKNKVSPLSNFTDDFVTHEEVVDGIAELTAAITVKETNAEYKNINVEVVVENGKIAAISYSYDFDAEISLKAAVVAINGTGSIKTETTYSDIAY
ncbi:MAG: hypothetical protein IJO03_02775 [Clostridia bacterium]|nr:hypothetical protein [Clostridia bacterium]